MEDKKKTPDNNTIDREVIIGGKKVILKGITPELRAWMSKRSKEQTREELEEQYKRCGIVPRPPTDWMNPRKLPE